MRGAISAVCAVEDLESIKPVISRKIWRMAKYSLHSDEEDLRSFRGLETLHLILQRSKDKVNWTVHGLDVLSFIMVVRVGETVSIRHRVLGDKAMCFARGKESPNAVHEGPRHLYIWLVRLA